MGSARALLSGAILGAGAMYFFDPRMGNRRRAALEGRLRRLSRQAASGIDAGLRDLQNRATGSMHEMSSLADRLRGNQSPASRGQSRRGDGNATDWAPGTRLLGVTAGTALMANCAACRTPAAVLWGTLGFGLFTRSVANKSLKQSFGLCHCKYAVDIQKTIEIHAPAAKAFDFFSNPENYTRISDVVTHVNVFGDGRFAKDMLIAGVPVHFEERFIHIEKDELLETRSEPSSAMQFHKQMCFEPIGDDHTRLHLHFSYNPPGGVIGHALATLGGFDAKTVLSELLMRAKYFLETGHEPHDAVGRKRGAARGTSHRSAQASRSSSMAPRGPGAPTEDVLRAGRAESGELRSPWPEAPNPGPEAGHVAGHFPPAISR